MAPTNTEGGPSRAASVDPAEIAKFSAMAAEWWDPEGKFRPLHQLNPTRLRFIRDRLAQRFEREPLGDRPLEGKLILDVGCGGGLVAEPLARLGARVTGIDASERNIAVARAHAHESGITIDYRETTAEALAAAGERFDAVLALEIVEHVTDPPGFVETCARLVAPGGALILSTLNRTPKSFLLGIVGAEYLLRWLPPGTHDWRRFLKPSELSDHVRYAGLEIEEVAGVEYNPLTASWRLTRDPSVNYMMLAGKDGD